MTDNTEGVNNVASDREDAARYRWLVAQFQRAYDGDRVDLDRLSLSCGMQFGRGDFRRVEAQISWGDRRDEPLGLSAAIDEAMLEQARMENADT